MSDKSLLQDFITETGEHLEETERNLLQLEQQQDDADTLNKIFRSIHTIKGSSEYLGLERVAELSHKLESLLELLRRPDVSYHSLTAIVPNYVPAEDSKVAEQVEIQAKYAGYLERQHAEIEKARRHEQTSIPNLIDYQSVRGLSAEVCQKLSDYRPETIGQASRIPGMTPAAISLLMVHLKKAAMK